MAGQPMTLEEIQKAFPVGAKVFHRRDTMRYYPYIIVRHNLYDYNDLRKGQWYLTIKEYGSTWPEAWVVDKPLSPLEQSISDYIAAEKRELGINA